MTQPPGSPDQPHEGPPPPEGASGQPYTSPGQPEGGAANQPYTSPGQPEGAANRPYTTPDQPQDAPNQPYTSPGQPEGGANQPYTTPDQPQTAAGQPYGAAQPYGGPAPMSPAQERNLGMLAHLVPAVLLPLSAGTLGFVASLVIYLLYRDRGPFVRQHAANSLNVQIITAILLLISAALMIVLVGFITYPLVIVVATIIHVVGAIKANNGDWWQPPLTPVMVR